MDPTVSEIRETRGVWDTKTKTKKFGTDFLTFKAQAAFFHLQKTFIKALIICHFDLKHHIQIETNISGVMTWLPNLVT